MVEKSGVENSRVEISCNYMYLYLYQPCTYVSYMDPCVLCKNDNSNYPLPLQSIVTQNPCEKHQVKTYPVYLEISSLDNANITYNPNPNNEYGPIQLLRNRGAFSYLCRNGWLQTYNRISYSYRVEVCINSNSVF